MRVLSSPLVYLFQISLPMASSWATSFPESVSSKLLRELLSLLWRKPLFSLLCHAYIDNLEIGSVLLQVMSVAPPRCEATALGWRTQSCAQKARTEGT